MEHLDPPGELLARRLVEHLPVIYDKDAEGWRCVLCDQFWRPGFRANLRVQVLGQWTELDWHRSTCAWRMAHELLQTPLAR